MSVNAKPIPSTPGLHLFRAGVTTCKCKCSSPRLNYYHYSLNDTVRLRGAFHMPSMKKNKQIRMYATVQYDTARGKVGRCTPASHVYVRRSKQKGLQRVQRPAASPGLQSVRHSKTEWCRGRHWERAPGAHATLRSVHRRLRTPAQTLDAAGMPPSSHSEGPHSLIAAPVMLHNTINVTCIPQIVNIT